MVAWLVNDESEDMQKKHSWPNTKYHLRTCIEQWLPNSDRDPNEGSGGSDVGSRVGFMKNSTITKKKMYLNSNRTIEKIH